ncbi:hypothetical protein G6L37_06845 [Agrobacterium rubi]|nr:hypothetical protein [Agrobacterium rubi]NTF25082.1 hypothetical protein [Agrobacterium rubi]
MIIHTAADAIRFATRKDEMTDDGTNILMRMRRESTMFYYENRDSIPDEKTYAEAAEFLQGITEVDISPDAAKAILALYPHARIKIAEYGVGDTECRDALCFVAAHFFLGSKWPNFGDKIDITLFVDCMKDEAVRMGFVTLSKEAQEA